MKNNKLLFCTLAVSALLFLNSGSAMAKPPLEFVNDTKENVTVTIKTLGGPGRETTMPKHIGFDPFSARRMSFQEQTLTYNLAPKETWKITKSVVIPKDLNLEGYDSYYVEFQAMTVKRPVKEGEKESLFSSTKRIHSSYEYPLDDEEEESQSTIKHKKYSIRPTYNELAGIYSIDEIK